MAANTFGHIIRLSSFGESHGTVTGGVIDGLPAGLLLDYAFIQRQLARRRPVSEEGGTDRQEEDQVSWLSGILDDKTTGAPLAFLVANNKHRSSDYSSLKEIYRPSHADYTWEMKYGMRDYRGGGRSSARETVVRVVAGAVVNSLLEKTGIKINAAVTQLGHVQAQTEYLMPSLKGTGDNPYSFAEPGKTKEIDELIHRLREEGDSTGGVIACVIENVPAGLGMPLYNKLQADLGAAMLSINSVKGFEYGSGFRGTSLRGSEHNDGFEKDKNGHIRTETNYSGGIQGGISNGEDICFRVAFKPVSSISRPQKVLTKAGEVKEKSVKGRHDICVVPRAVPVVEAMAALVIADHLLWTRSDRM